MATAGAGSLSAGAELLNVAGFGNGGITELTSKLDPAQVTFAVARVPVGSGTFAREKVILLHVNSDGCSAIKRGRINGKKGAVKAALGEIHAELILSDVKDVHLDGVLEELRKFIASDDSGTFSIAKMKADYEAMIEKSRSAKSDGAAGVVLSRKTAAELGSVKAEAALKAVREPLGAWNWVLFSPDFDFINAGSLSVPEMIPWLKDDQFYYGLVRLGFGTGRFRRTKWVFVTWTGSKMGTVKRAHALGKRGTMKGRLGPASVDLEAASHEEISLPAVIDKVKRAAVVDGDEVHSAEDPYSLENFMKALQEEAAASAAFFGDSGLQIGGGSTKTVSQLLHELRAAGSATNWAAFIVNA